jgi:hypothetical protein
MTALPFGLSKINWSTPLVVLATSFNSLDIGLPLRESSTTARIFWTDYLLPHTHETPCLASLALPSEGACIHDKAKGQPASARVSRDFWRAWRFSSMA